MPNWVINTIKVTCSDPATLETYFKIVGRPGETLDFNRIVPMPQELDIDCGSRTGDGLTCVRWYAHPETPRTKINDIIPKLTPEQYAKLPNSSIDLNKTWYEVTKLQEGYEKRGGGAWEDVLKFGQQACSNILNYGYPTWYEWRLENWGTKWNAHDNSTIDDDGAVSFSTAWSAPMPVISKIVELMVRTPGLHGTMRIEHRWADEDIGNNCGEQSFEIDFDDPNPEESTQWDCIDDYKMSEVEARKFARDLWGWEPDDDDDSDDDDDDSDDDDEQGM